MRHLARGILVVVGLFVLVVAGTLVARSRTARVEPVEPAASRADLVIKEVQIEEETDGVRWRLTAEQAAIFEKEDRTTLRRIAVSVHERERAWTIVGDEGDLYQKAKRVDVRGNIVLTSNDGLRVETERIRWDGHGKRVWTDAPVTLSRRGSVIRGAGLEVRVSDEMTTLRGRVHAVFAKEGGR